MSHIALIVISAVVLIGIVVFKIVRTKSNPNRRIAIAIYITLGLAIFVVSLYHIPPLTSGTTSYGETLHTFYGEDSCALFVKAPDGNYSLVFYVKDDNGNYLLKDMPNLVQRGPCKIGSYTIYQVYGTDDLYVFLSTRLTTDTAEIRDVHGNKLLGTFFEWDISGDAKYMYEVAGYVGNTLEGYSICIDDEIIEIG